MEADNLLHTILAPLTVLCFGGRVGCFMLVSSVQQVTKCDGGIRESKRRLPKATAANAGLCCGNLWKACSALHVT